MTHAWSIAVVAALLTGCAWSGGADEAPPGSTSSPGDGGGVAPEPLPMARIPATSRKRGVAFHYCGWPFSEGRADLEAMRPGLAWTYNWSVRPLTCADGHGVGAALGDGAPVVEFVPMAWGLVDAGARCAEGGLCFRVDERDGGAACRAVCEASGWSMEASGGCYACLHEGITRDEMVAEIPEGAAYLLGFNEPNFKEQANLTPSEAARGWEHVEWVAERRELTVVGPAVNFCDPTPGAQHPGACVEVADGAPMQGFAWLERFYDACSATGAAGRDCRIDHQAAHVYSCGGVGWYLDIMKRKAGLLPASEAHCGDGVQNEDEFGVDCGGNSCAACSARARALFARPVWLTEFAPTRGDCPGLEGDALAAQALRFVDEAVPMLERDPYVFRYAWFMPKTDAPTLDHVDLLVEGEAGRLTPLGERYFGIR